MPREMQLPRIASLRQFRNAVNSRIERVKYWFDIRFTERPWLLPGMLLASLLLIVIALIVGDEIYEGLTQQSATPPEKLWWEFLGRAFGADSVGEPTYSWAHKAALLVVTIVSVVIIGAFAGSITTWLAGRIELMRRGRGKVRERGHTLIIGWSPGIGRIVQELAEANRSEGGRPIVILAERDKVDMDEELRERLPAPSRYGSRVITRHGSGSKRADLTMVSVGNARSILLLPDQSGTDDQQIATAAAICHHPEVAARIAARDLTFVAPVRQAGSIETLQSAMGDLGVWVPQGRTVAKVIALAARQSGLAHAYEMLFSFRGSELYFWPTMDRRRGHRENRRSDQDRRHGRASEIADLRGLSFRVIQHGFVAGTPVGLRTAAGRVVLNPPGDRVIEDGDQLIMLAEDNDPGSIRFDRALAESHASVPTTPAMDPHGPPLMRIVIVGLGTTTGAALQELDGHVAPGSEFLLLTTIAESDGPSAPTGLQNARLAVMREPELSTESIRNALSPGADAVLVFPERAEEGDHDADMRTVSTLLKLRTCLAGGQTRARIVSEVLDEKNIDLVDVARPDDAVMSDKLVSLYCLQLSEERGLLPVYEELLDSKGCEISFHPVEWYVPLGVETDFHVAIDCASAARTTVIGYRHAAMAEDRTRNFGIVMNPAKNGTFLPMEGDSLIVIASH